VNGTEESTRHVRRRRTERVIRGSAPSKCGASPGGTKRGNASQTRLRGHRQRRAALTVPARSVCRGSALQRTAQALRLAVPGERARVEVLIDNAQGIADLRPARAAGAYPLAACLITYSRTWSAR